MDAASIRQRLTASTLSGVLAQTSVMISLERKTMSDDNQDSRDPEVTDTSNAEIEREIRSRRKYSLAEAIGRSAGDLMKGASPVSRKQQAEFEIEELLERYLTDSEGALSDVLLRRVKQSEELLEDYESPRAVLAGVLRHLLSSEERLRRFVRQVDAEWGRMYSELPHFDHADRASDANDPYTSASVSSTLEALLKAVDGPDHVLEQDRD